MKNTLAASLAVYCAACLCDAMEDYYENQGPGAYPLVPSPSGMMELSEEGIALLEEIQIRDGEAIPAWLERLRERVPQLTIGDALSGIDIVASEKSSGIDFPSSLEAVWRQFGSMEIEHDTILLSPSEIKEFNGRYSGHLPSILKEKIFIGGMDGHNFAISLRSDDHSVSDWEDESGWSEHRESTIYRHLSERIAWYVTYMTPFCYEHGYIAPDKYP